LTCWTLRPTVLAEMPRFSAIAWLGSARTSTGSARKHEEDFQLALPQAGQQLRGRCRTR
jgi:hypothetical protein